MSDPEILKMVTDLLSKVASHPSVSTATKDLMMESTSTVLQDEEIVARSKEFVADVMGDDMLQREGGDALFKSVAHALKPGVIRVAGVAIVAISFAVIKLLSSPF